MILLLILFSLWVEPWEVHYSQGRLLAQKGDWKQAEAEFRQVVSGNSAFLPGRLALGTVLEQTGDWTGAESEFRAALLLDPKSTYGLGQLAQSLMMLRRSSAAASRPPARTASSSEIDIANEIELGVLDPATARGLIGRDARLHYRLCRHETYRR